MVLFVGRTEPLARLSAVHQAAAASAGPAGRRPGLVLVTGQAGIGKTALLTRYAADATARGATVVWGTCWDGDQAPAWWPWTQALRTLLDRHDGLRTDLDPALAAILPAPAAASPVEAAADAGQFQIFDAVGRLLGLAGAAEPVVVLLDDLQWADRSTVDLLRFLAHQPRTGGVVLVGAYRPGEARDVVAAALAELSNAAELVPLGGLPPADVTDLVRTIAGDSAAADWAGPVYERSGGHPFFAGELCRLLAAGGDDAWRAAVPVAVREAIGSRLARLPAACAELLDAAAVGGSVLLPDVLAEVTGSPPTTVFELIDRAAAAGVLMSAGPKFAHDLYRETILAALPPARRLELHHRTAVALAHRYERGSQVFPADLARHFAAAVPLAGAGPALSWARAAADADRAGYAFTDAAGQLARARAAVTDAGDRLTAAELVLLLTEEADLRLRGGDAGTARALLDTAWARATPTGDAALLGAVALGLDRIGARFAMPRTDLIAVLETARSALAGAGSSTEAQVTAAIARQLQHSVSMDRRQAGPLAERAVAIARGLDDPATLANCLLAQHDTLWTAGTAGPRQAIATEIAELARRTGDQERHAQALLLTATAQLESGSAAFRATLSQYRYITEQLRQPRQTYNLRIRDAALALLDGDIDRGERLADEAAALGEAVGDGDTGNVRMSQRLEITRCRADPAELRATAAAAVDWWIGAPAHAHAVAAGFFARAGDLGAARREVDTVLALEDWRTDRSYLWSVFVGELATAAIALADRPLCARLLDDLLPHAETCAVNAALVCFMGAHAHRVGLLYAALGDQPAADRWLRRALEVHRQLGAQAWEAETRAALAGLPLADGPVTLRRSGDLWTAGFRGHTAYLRDAKGLHDLATLLDRPGAAVPAVQLANRAYPAESSGQDPVLDRRALQEYRQRLAELAEELDTAQALSDEARRRRATDEREQLLAELRRATRPGGASRPLGPSAAERARKAVTARLRDAIRRIAEVHPDLGDHLDRTVHTGSTCRYDPQGEGQRR
ncbi:ATP-binding protein [Actinoplanes sp. NPDC049668]|uniref:ATP-binding protein n=1 Tax=unclassified Actinoplanes TaxID=2626549 RepID=UPI0033A4BBFB